MKVQSIKREHLIALASGFEDEEDRQKVLRVIYEEVRRDYSSVIWRYVASTITSAA